MRIEIFAANGIRARYRHIFVAKNLDLSFFSTKTKIKNIVLAFLLWLALLRAAAVWQTSVAV